MIDILKSGSIELGCGLSDLQIDKLVRYYELLVEWNEKINLTAITEKNDVATKHFLDSMSAISTGYVKGKTIDVGCGAGFPGLVLKITKPEIELTLLDSLNKRIHSGSEDIRHCLYDPFISNYFMGDTVLTEYYRVGPLWTYNRLLFFGLAVVMLVATFFLLRREKLHQGFND